MVKAADRANTSRKIAKNTTHTEPSTKAASLFKLIYVLGIDTTSKDGLARTLPFSPSDTTAGSENEYQTAVIGEKGRVDLALEIEGSGFFRNLEKRALRGDTPHSSVIALESFLSDNESGIWENSWVRLPVEVLNPYAREIFKNDLRSDKQTENSPQRSDACRFSTTINDRK